MERRRPANTVAFALNPRRAGPAASPAFDTLGAGTLHAAISASPHWAGVINFFGVSPRERQIIECLLGGVEGDAAIGDRLGVSARTVHTHVERLYRKVSVTSRSQLLARLFVAYATRANGGDNGP